MRAALLLVALVFASAAAAAQDLNLPVSLDHIRAGLSKPQPTFSFNFGVPSTFRTEVHERDKVEALMKPAPPDVSGGPVPAGGLYGYEAQRRMLNPIEYPLTQPYAAFSNGELLTVSLEALAEEYLGGRALDSVTSSERARAEAQARQEVLRAIGDYCAASAANRAQTICQNR